MCIKEGLRCHCPVFFIQRQVTEDIEIEGYKIPSWTHIAINLYNVHHNATVWGPDHMEYKPDRFLPENISKMDTFAFIPFSAGVRYIYNNRDCEAVSIPDVHYYNIAIYC